MNQKGLLIQKGKTGTQFGKSTAVKLTIAEKPKKVLIVSILSLLNYWVEHLNQFYPDIFTFCIPISKMKKRNEKIKKFLRTYSRSKIKIVLINYESVWRFDPDIISDERWDVIILDHCERIKNPSTEVSIFLHQLQAKKKFAIFEPLSCDIQSFFSICKFIDKNLFGPSFFKFNERYVKYNNHPCLRYQITGYKNQDEFSEKIKSIMIKEDD